jgi:hypothetical protein
LPRAPTTHEGTDPIVDLDPKPDPQVISFRLTPEALDALNNPPIIPANGRDPD